MKTKILILWVLLLTSAASSWAEIIDSGTCGENLTWTLSDDSTLTISGTGAMRDIGPWYSYRSLIATVIIENGVTSIGYQAFHYCSALTSIIIPNSVTSIEKRTFYYCSALTTIQVEDGNVNFSSYDGVLLKTVSRRMGTSALFCCPEGKTGACTIPKGVVSIEDYAFARCSRLEAILVEDGSAYFSSEDGVLFNIDKTVLVGYPGGKGEHYTIPNSVTSIGNYAFVDCSALTSVTIPNSVTSIGEFAFADCSALTSVIIGNGVTSIGGRAFLNCSNLTSVTIGNGVTSIGESVFSGCSSLTAIQVEDGNVYFSSEDGVLFSNNKSVLVTCPEGKSGHYTIPNSVNIIRNSAFSNCSGLTSITIPNSVVTIGSDAFYRCISLTSVTNLNPIPQNIASNVFQAVSLKYIPLYVPAESVEAYKTADVWKDFGMITAYGVAPSGTCGENLTWTLSDSTLTISGTGAMADYLQYTGTAPWYLFRTSITTVIMENGVTSIGNYAFADCSVLTSITVPNSVTSIGALAFYGCRNLTSVTFPASVTSIGTGAFDGCSSLTDIIVESGNENYSSDNGVLFNKEKTTLIRYPIGKKDEHYTVPNGVTTIGAVAFYGCGNLTSITLPNSVTTIGAVAFYGCSSLTSVIIPNSVTGVGDYAFLNCNSLTSITIPNSVTSIGDRAFSGCDRLTDIVVESGNENYSSDNGILFNKEKTTLICYPAGKENENYTVPNSVTTIEAGAFYGCNRLISITIPNSVTSIGASAFSGCSSLTSVTIPNSVTGIGVEVFYNCSALTSVTIPESVTYIMSYAFGYCSNLTSVTNLNPTPQNITVSVFSDVDLSKATLYVPAGSVANYKTTNVWKDFGTITEYIPSAIHTPEAENAVRIYPNPVTESFLVGGITSPAQVVVTDISGKTVLQQTAKNNESISVGHLPQGVYLVRVNGKTVKVIKNP